MRETNRKYNIILDMKQSLTNTPIHSSELILEQQGHEILFTWDLNFTVHTWVL